MIYAWHIEEKVIYKGCGSQNNINDGVVISTVVPTSSAIYNTINE
jgi:hypothetical protein